MKLAAPYHPVANHSLHQFINHLLSDLISQAAVHQTRLINEVDKAFQIDAGDAAVVATIKNLVHTVVSNSHRGDIHISAERFSDITVINIQERNNNNGYALSYSIGALEPDAVSVGGHIAIRGPQQRITTISFSFPAITQAA